MTRSERRRLQKWRDDGGRAFFRNVFKLEEEVNDDYNNYKRRYYIGKCSVFRRLFVKDDLSKPAEEEEVDTSVNIGKRRV